MIVTLYSTVQRFIPHITCYLIYAHVSPTASSRHPSISRDASHPHLSPAPPLSLPLPLPFPDPPKLLSPPPQALFPLLLAGLFSTPSTALTTSSASFPSSAALAGGNGTPAWPCDFLRGLRELSISFPLPFPLTRKDPPAPF